MNITAEDKWTGWARPSGNGEGIDIIIEDPKGATVTVEHRLGGLIVPEGSYTIATSTNFIASHASEYRVGVKIGDFGTGSFNVGIGG